MPKINSAWLKIMGRDRNKVSRIFSSEISNFTSQITKRVVLQPYHGLQLSSILILDLQVFAMCIQNIMLVSHFAQFISIATFPTIATIPKLVKLLS